MTDVHAPPQPTDAPRSLRLIAHRGWSTRFPENTLAAFAAALAAGADELEFDVRISADGVPVVLHDATLERVTDLTGAVAQRTIAELETARTRGIVGTLEMGVTRLDTVLALFAPHVGMNVHVKEVGDGRALRMVEAAARTSPHAIYLAGDATLLRAALDLTPDVPRCCLERQGEPPALIDHALRFRCQGVQFLSTRYDATLVARGRAQGLFCNLFYADTPDDARRAIAAGIDGILTNDVGPIRRALA